MTKQTKILFLGCGKMGSILAEKLERNHLTILTKSGKKISDLAKNYQADLVFLAVKPQDSEEILKKFFADGSERKIFHKNTIFISILAGKKIAFFEKIFGANAKIIRSMPNLPIAENTGIFAYFPNKNVSATEEKNLTKIFADFGTLAKLTDEKKFDAVTAIFGSGPAYIFLLQEILTEVAIASGINKDNASELVKELLIGSSLMALNAEKNFQELRQSVTSKGGTTAAALEILQKNSALKKLFEQAIKAAIKRSQELSK